MNKIKDQVWLSVLIIFLCLTLIAKWVQTQEFHHFLTLPFTEVQVRVQQGWLYTNSKLHAPIGAIDFARADFETFTVIAAADGIAIQDIQTEEDGKVTGYGNMVIIRHDETKSEGLHYFTLYAHLDPETIDSRIPMASRFKKIVEEVEDVDSEVEGFRVRRGDAIAITDTTGYVTCIDCSILHFEVFVGGYFQNMVDPYDISTSLLPKDRSFYPGGNLFTDCGPDYLWTECPPLTGPQPTIPPIIQDFNFALDSFIVDGNILGSGDADGILDFFDDFNDGSLTTPPTSSFSFPQGIEATNESGGFLNFSNSDGVFMGDGGGIFDHAQLNHFLTNGGGDSVIAAVFRADTPELDQFYSLGISDEFNTKPNLAFVFVRSFADESNAFVVAQQITGEGSETLAISEVDLTSVDRIFLLFVVLDDTNELIPLYSIDEGMTFIEFSPQPLRVFTTGNSAAVFAQGGFLSDVRCGDGIDNDGDGLMDSDDPDCL